MRRLECRDSKAMPKSPSLSTRPKENIKQEQIDDAILLQEITPEWQFQLYPSPTTFHTLPAEQSTEGFVNRYPRLGECQSLTTFLIQYFPEKEGGIRDVRMSNHRKMSRTCLMLRCDPKLRPIREEVDERSAESQPRDDTYRINHMIEEPRNYPFKGRGSSYLLPPRGFSRGESPTSYIQPRSASASPTTTPNASNSGTELPSETYIQLKSASMHVHVSRISSSSNTPESKDDTETLNSQRPYPRASSWSELVELIGPLPLVIVDPNGFSAQNEFQPFLVSGPITTNPGSSNTPIFNENAERVDSQ